jgi:acyl-CoA synthetase (AMP-forming)/AMP-acid ligase II
MSLGKLLDPARQRTPDKPALWFGDDHWSYARLDEESDALAASLRAVGVRPGDRVALFLPNCPELVLSYLGCFKLGAITVPLNYRYREPEARYGLEHSGAGTLIVHESLVGEVAGLPLADMRVSRRYLAGGTTRPGFAPFGEMLARQGKPTQPAFGDDQPAAILYTSGSTAKPKGVTYTHGTLWQNCLIQSETFAFTADDVHLVSTAACHAAAFTAQLLPGFYTGATCVLTHLPTPEQVVSAITRRGVTRIQMLPASLEDLVEYLEQRPDSDMSSLRCCTAGGDVVPVELHERFRKAVGFDVTELYGMTEVLSCLTNPPFGPKKLGSVGWPAAKTECRVVDGRDRDLPAGQAGELLVKSPAMLVGYWNNPEATSEALRSGWMHTGDLARRDEDGCFWFVGRKKEIIIRAGSNISPLEVEEALDEHPAVRISCVVGKPDHHLGEVVVAFVALKPDTESHPTPEELRAFVASRIATYKVPVRITILEELPLNPTGKVDRVKLHALVRAESD